MNIQSKHLQFFDLFTVILTVVLLTLPGPLFYSIIIMGTVFLLQALKHYLQLKDNLVNPLKSGRPNKAILNAAFFMLVLLELTTLFNPSVSQIFGLFFLILYGLTVLVSFFYNASKSADLFKKNHFDKQVANPLFFHVLNVICIGLMIISILSVNNVLNFSAFNFHYLSILIIVWLVIKHYREKQLDAIGPMKRHLITLLAYRIGLGLMISAIALKDLHWPNAGYSYILGSGLLVVSCALSFFLKDYLLEPETNDMILDDTEF